RGLVDTPVRKHTCLDVAPVPVDAFGTEDRVADLQFSEGLGGAVRHENWRTAIHAVHASMFAAPVGIDGLPKVDVGRFVAADDRARGLGQHDGLDATRLFILEPAIVLESLGEVVEAAGRL